MNKVFLGVGHGGSDPGAIGNGFHEKDLNLSIATHCKNELEQNGVAVKMSRYIDENDRLIEEIKECNSYNPDLCVDIHNNAGGGDGFEVYYSHIGGKSLEMAKNIENHVIGIGQNSRGCKTKLNQSGNDQFGFIRQTKAPAVLVECAFVDTRDIEIIDTEEERKLMGIAIARGIIKTLGVSSKPVDPPVQVKPNPALKSIEEIATEVIAGKWGNGEERKNRLTVVGYDYVEIQNAVNAKLGTSTATLAKKSVDEIAMEVINGKWGNGQDRKNRLTAAGYNYSAVQSKVNSLL